VTNPKIYISVFLLSPVRVGLFSSDWTLAANMMCLIPTYLTSLFNCVTCFIYWQKNDSEWWIKKAMDGCVRDIFKVIFQHFPGSTVKKPWKTSDGQSLPQELNSGSPEYEAVITTIPRRPVDKVQSSPVRYLARHSVPGTNFGKPGHRQRSLLD
jgi:hypothetical protein